MLHNVVLYAIPHKIQTILTGLKKDVSNNCELYFDN